MDLKVNLYKQNGDLAGEIKLNPRIFGITVNPALMAQAVHVYQSNQRRGTASTKGRGAVSGGGRKPWKQKGTGRARQGSTRSPIWTKGGVAHGPEPREWSLTMNQNMRIRALFSALSSKYNEKQILVLEDLDSPQIKTKEFAAVLKTFEINKPVLIVLPEKMENLYLSARNLTDTTTIMAKDLNTYQVLKSQKILFLKDSLAKIEAVFLKNKTSGKTDKEDKKKVSEKPAIKPENKEPEIEENIDIKDIKEEATHV